MGACSERIGNRETEDQSPFVFRNPSPDLRIMPEIGIFRVIGDKLFFTLSSCKMIINPKGPACPDSWLITVKNRVIRRSFNVSWKEISMLSKR